MDNIPHTEKIDVTNPVTGQIIGRVSPALREEVQNAVERARAAQPGWAALPVRERTRILRRWANLVWKDQDRALDIICAETGKARVSAFNELFVTDNITAYCVYHAPHILRPQIRRALFPLFHQAQVYYKPHGVVGLITPWNYPYLLAFCDLIPALTAGNAVVLKPSEITPFSAHYGVEMLHEAGVPGEVVQVVNGASETGAALVDCVDYIAFTGSTAVGRQIAQRAAQRLIPCSLELGGKDALIVLKDADLEQAASGIVIGALENAGQACASVERVYVDRAVYDELIEHVRQRASQVLLGTTYTDHMGSLTGERELLRTEAHIREAVNKGARLLYGGQRRPELGPLFLEPAVLVDVDHSMCVMQEESFGPIIAMMPVNSEAEAVRLANDNPYGLSATVYTRDLRHGIQIARQIDSGDAAVNRPLAIWGTADAPMGGRKDSGIGRRNGPEGLLRFVTSQTVVVDTVPRLIAPPAAVHLTPRMRWLIGLRRRLMPYLPFLRP